MSTTKKGLRGKKKFQRGCPYSQGPGIISGAKRGAIKNQSLRARYPYRGVWPWTIERRGWLHGILPCQTGNEGVPHLVLWILSGGERGLSSGKKAADLQNYRTKTNGVLSPLQWFHSAEGGSSVADLPVGDANICNM